jgi:predicted nucleic acid-binding protein
VGLIEDIGEGPLAIDTVVFIYFIEEHPGYLELLTPLFEALDRGALLAFTSGLTLMEVLVTPYRTGDMPLAEQYEAIFTRSRGLELVEIDRQQLRTAAQLRAVYEHLRTPDALQISAALARRCTAFLTNDRKLPKVPGLRTLQLSSYGRPGRRKS